MGINALGIHSPSPVMHRLGVHTAAGFVNGVNSGQGAVAGAFSNMATIPNSPNQGRFGGGTQISLSIDRSDPLVAAVADMMDLRINGAVVKLGRAGQKRQGQPV